MLRTKPGAKTAIVVSDMSARDVYLVVMIRGARTAAAAVEEYSSLILTATGARAHTVTRRNTVADQAGMNLGVTLTDPEEASTIPTTLFGIVGTAMKTT